MKTSDLILIVGILVMFGELALGFGTYAGLALIALGWLIRQDEHAKTIVRANKILAGFVLSLDVIAVPAEVENS